MSAQSTSDITNSSNLMAATEPLAATITLNLSTVLSVLGIMMSINNNETLSEFIRIDYIIMDKSWSDS